MKWILDLTRKIHTWAIQRYMTSTMQPNHLFFSLQPNVPKLKIALLLYWTLTFFSLSCKMLQLPCYFGIYNYWWCEWYSAFHLIHQWPLSLMWAYTIECSDPKKGTYKTCEHTNGIQWGKERDTQTKKRDNQDENRELSILYIAIHSSIRS